VSQICNALSTFVGVGARVTGELWKWKGRMRGNGIPNALTYAKTAPGDNMVVNSFGLKTK